MYTPQPKQPSKLNNAFDVLVTTEMEERKAAKRQMRNEERARRREAGGQGEKRWADMSSDSDSCSVSLSDSEPGEDVKLVDLAADLPMKAAPKEKPAVNKKDDLAFLESLMGASTDKKNKKKKKSAKKTLASPNEEDSTPDVPVLDEATVTAARAKLAAKAKAGKKKVRGDTTLNAAMAEAQVRSEVGKQRFDRG
ncbi:MAG: uncharacterized protein KVP18_004148 [Porospora cf. gigantea A]|uniref:uncharacterized protein n=1 Tax=Porospora cf. gigantea A TaxID=2853593 RepID=UPI0035593FAF|nr:MAG: hypothetical protein KVP18_004148 [Porospora cf. gigantea A]